MKVDVLLDVDGVLNALPDVHWLKHWGWGDNHAKGYVRMPHFGFDRSFKIRWSPDLIDRLNGFQKSGVRFHWLTTWCEQAPALLPELTGIEGANWPVLESDGSPWGQGWWKLACAERHVSENPENKVIWIDDDLSSSKSAQEFIAATPNLMGVCPDSRYGITPTLLEAIEEFINEA